MSPSTTYPIGRSGEPWGDAEKREWLSRQRRHRSYPADVLEPIDRLRSRFEVMQYGQLDYSPDTYPLFALRGGRWRENRPYVLVTGGVHGYETSGVHGALRFLERHAADYEHRVNLLVAPCVSPWAYERIHRWNPKAIDPNRSFFENSPAEESAALMRLIAPWRDRFLLHIDLHETTDSDETEFRPAKAARDGVTSEPETIPDGFYLVGDAENPQLDFQNAVIAAVQQVTHIAPADAKDQIIGSPVVAPGVILYEMKKLGLCGSVTRARFHTTTEVYPDSPRVTADECNEAQVTAVRAAIDFALRAPVSGS